MTFVITSVMCSISMETTYSSLRGSDQQADYFREKNIDYIYINVNVNVE